MKSKEEIALYEKELDRLIESNRQLEMVMNGQLELIWLLKRKCISEKECSDLPIDFDECIPSPAAENHLQNIYVLKRQSAQTVNRFVTVISKITVSEYNSMTRILSVPENVLRSIEQQNNSHRQKIAILVDMQHKNKSLQNMKGALKILKRFDLLAQLSDSHSY